MGMSLSLMTAYACHARLCHPLPLLLSCPARPPASSLLAGAHRLPKKHGAPQKARASPPTAGGRPTGWASTATACLHGVAGPLERLAGSGAAPGRHPPAELWGPELHLVPAPAPVCPPAGAWPPAEPQWDLQGERPLRVSLAPWHGLGLRSDPRSWGVTGGPRSWTLLPTCGAGPWCRCPGASSWPLPGVGGEGLVPWGGCCGAKRAVPPSPAPTLCLCPQCPCLVPTAVPGPLRWPCPGPVPAVPWPHTGSALALHPRPSPASCAWPPQPCPAPAVPACPRAPRRPGTAPGVPAQMGGGR